MTVLLQDLRFAARALIRSRGFTFVALLTLALGIGLNTAMFNVAHAVLWRSLPYPHPDRLVMVGEVGAHDPDNYWGASYTNFRDWQSRATSFEHLAAVLQVEHTLRQGASPIRVSGAAVSPDFFQCNECPLLLMGRIFGEAEDRKGAPGVVVLSHRLWVERFAADPTVLGRSIYFGATPYSVIGIMPAEIPSIAKPNSPDSPCLQEMDPQFVTHRNIWVLDPIGRLRPGVQVAAATKEVEAIAAQIRRDYPETRRDQVVRVSPLRFELSRDLRPAMLALLGAVGVVLLIVCGNIAALMLVRGTARAREIAIRRALGVGHARLVRQLLTESALLACVGGAAGIGIAFVATRSLALLTQDPRLLNLSMDSSVLAFAAAATVATTILFGLDSGHQRRPRRRRRSAQKRHARRRLASKSPRATNAGRPRSCLVPCIAGRRRSSHEKLSQSLRSQSRFSNRPTRHPARRGLPPNYDSDPVVNQFHRHLIGRLSSLPGVSGATIVSQLPISGGEGTGDISIEGRPSAEGELGASTFRRVLPNYFFVMGIPLIRGRFFENRDDVSPKVHPVIVNQAFARRFWPNTDPVGKRFKVGPRDRASWLSIVGVVGDVHQVGLDSSAPFSTYEPMASDPHTPLRYRRPRRRRYQHRHRVRAPRTAQPRTRPAHR